MSHVTPILRRKKELKPSPYSLASAALIENGYSAIPVAPGTKVPGTRKAGRWIAEHGWQRFCERLPTDLETSIWNTWQDAGVCIALGFNDVVAVDIDTDSPSVTSAIMAVLPPAYIAKRGRKGRTVFYRAGPAVVSQPFDIGKTRVLDLLCHGRQTVLPPTVHPNTGQPYIWTTPDTLEDTPADQLPRLPDDIAARLAGALAPFGYHARPEPRQRETDADTPWREVNDMALASFDSWVPALGIPFKRSGRGTYRAVATWRGGDGFNVSFHPAGIRDMRDDVGLSPLDVAMRAGSIGFDEAFEWLAGRVGYQRAPAVKLRMRAEA